MFQYFAKNTCERYGAVIGWVRLVPFFEYRGHINRVDKMYNMHQLKSVEKQTF